MTKMHFFIILVPTANHDQLGFIDKLILTTLYLRYLQNAIFINSIMKEKYKLETSVKSDEIKNFSYYPIYVKKHFLV